MAYRCVSRLKIAGDDGLKLFIVAEYNSNAGDPPDMSGASAGNLVLATANTFLSVSTDDGVTFTPVAITMIFPGIASPAKDSSGNVIDNGSCCDQSVRYLAR